MSAVCMTALPSTCAAQSKPTLIASIKYVNTSEQLHEWLTYYYLHPRPELTISALHLMSREGLLSKPDPQTAVAAFFAQLFRSNRPRLKAWIADLDAGVDDEKTMAALGLWMAHTEDASTLLQMLATHESPSFQKYVDGLRGDGTPPDFLADNISSPGFLDALWGSFFATGDERYVRRVISALPLLASKDAPPKVLTGSAAKWSLQSNATQHPRVLKICEQELKGLSDDQTATLAEIIQSARKGTQ